MISSLKFINNHNLHQRKRAGYTKIKAAVYYPTETPHVYQSKNNKELATIHLHMHLQQYQQYNFHYRSLISQVERKGSAYFQFFIIFDNLNSERWTRPTARMTTEN